MPRMCSLPPGRRAGFALLITITLLAFLVLLLVSLASFTRVETQVAENTRQQSQARQNALMALNVALGRLQAAAGPDQRVTATADIVAGANDDKRRWTGVWDTTAASPSPAWLVSTADPSHPFTGAAAVTSAPPSAGSIVLVGGGSVDPSVPGERVQVEEYELKGSAPGLAGSDLPIGHTAWWVGDEGVKAKVSLIDPGAAATATAVQKAFRLRVAQRTGVELVEAAAGAPLGAAWPANDAALSRLVDLQQMPMISAAGAPALATAAKNRFHDLTTDSFSVLADVAKGGLRKDLTAWLASPAPAAGAPADTDRLFEPAAGDPDIFGGLAPSGGLIPRWGILRSYAGLTGGAAHAPQAQTDRQQGFHPVVTYARLGFSAHSSALPITPPVTTPDENADTRLIAQAFPLVVLWNPYNTPIAAASYELVFGFRFDENIVQFTINGIFKASLVLTGIPRLITAQADDAPLPYLDTDDNNRRMLRFVVNSPQIAPGQSLVFTLDGSGDYISPSDNNAAMIRMSANNPPASDNSVFFGARPADTPVPLTKAERAADTKVLLGKSTSSIQFRVGLYPLQPAGAEPSAAAFLNQPAYQLMSWFRPGVYNPTDIGRLSTRPVTDPDDPGGAIPALDPKNAFLWTRHLMAGHPASQYYLTPRVFAQLAPLAPYNLPFGNETVISSRSGSFVVAGDIAQSSSYATPANWEIFNGNKAYAGATVYDTAGAPATLQLAELAPASAQPGARFFSLAQLQHANFALLAQNVGAAVGNSEIPFSIAAAGRTLTSRAVATPSDTNVFPNKRIKWLYDLSYLLNQALWDHYFFSTIPPALTDAQIADPAFHLPAARLVFDQEPGATPAAASLTGPAAFHTAAAGLLLNGGFNVNSTSVQAWRALLAAHAGIDDRPGPPACRHPYARFSATVAGDPANATDWSSGYRILSDDQIESLAEKIVAEVRARAPFLSLAGFVNRSLRNDPTALKGPLQAAIDATDAEADAARRINDRAPFNNPAYQVGPDSIYGGTSGSPATTDEQKKVFLASDEINLARPSASRAAFAPGFLTQADLLNALGPVLAARSDTFRIRAYGDVQNPVTGGIEGKAWCEAIVQRVVEPVRRKSSDPASPDYNEPDTAATPDFGRRFKIVSFRWLSANDL